MSGVKEGRSAFGGAFRWKEKDGIVMNARFSDPTVRAS